MIKKFLLLLKIIYLIVRIPAFLWMGLGYMMDGSAKADAGNTYQALSLWTGFLISALIITGFRRPIKWGGLIFIVLLAFDTLFFYSISYSFPYADKSFANEHRMLALCSLIILVFSCIGEFFYKRQIIKQ